MKDTLSNLATNKYSLYQFPPGDINFVSGPCACVDGTVGKGVALKLLGWDGLT